MHATQWIWTRRALKRRPYLRSDFPTLRIRVMNVSTDNGYSISLLFPIPLVYLMT